MKYYLIYILFFFLFGCSSFKATDVTSNKDEGFTVEVKQTVYGVFIQNTYVIENDRLFIYERTITKKGDVKVKKIYSKKIKYDKLKKIKSLSLGLLNLNNKYVNSYLGGMRWEISFRLDDGSNKKIVLENFALYKVNEIFNTINTIIPKNKPRIQVADFK